MNINQIVLIYRTYGFIKSSRMAMAYLIDIILDKYYKSLPISSNLILFDSVPEYDDNARVLYDYMVSTGIGKKYDMRWVVRSNQIYSTLTKKGLKCVLRYSISPQKGLHRYNYYGRSARWYFSTHGHPFIDGGKVGQHFVNLAHGGPGFKINKSNGNVGPALGKNCEYTITSGSGNYCLEYIQQFCECAPNKILPMGLPRYDLFFVKKMIPEFDSLPGKKILWMPTFRESTNQFISDKTLSSETGLPVIYTINDVSKLNKLLTKLNVHLFITTHPLQKKEKRPLLNLSNIHSIDADSLKQQDIQLYEIFSHFDAMISDYSSVTFDFMVLNKPIGYTLDDYEQYKVVRGFYMNNPLEYMPGPHIYSYEDFVSYVQDIANGNDNYSKERENLLTKLEIHADGNCCKRIVEFFNL